MTRDGGRRATGSARPEASPIVRARRMLLKARDAFYEQRYRETVERCQESLAALLPDVFPPPNPEDLGDRFLGAYASVLPILDAERITEVFTFFEDRRERFRFERGRPLPEREWWLILRVTREEASAALGATRIAVEAVSRSGSVTPSP